MVLHTTKNGRCPVKNDFSGWMGRRNMCMKEKYLSCTFMEKGNGGDQEGHILSMPSMPVHGQVKAAVGFSFEIFRHFLYLRIYI